MRHSVSACFSCSFTPFLSSPNFNLFYTLHSPFQSLKKIFVQPVYFHPFIIFYKFIVSSYICFWNYFSQFHTFFLYNLHKKQKCASYTRASLISSLHSFCSTCVAGTSFVRSIFLYSMKAKDRQVLTFKKIQY